MAGPPDPVASQGAESLQSGLYAGIGARRTPPEVLVAIEAIATRLARRGWTLRTGMSPGADQAFYRGARAGGGRAELYLPWPGFEAGAWSRGDGDAGCEDDRRGDGGERVRVFERPSSEAYELAARFHPDWEAVSADSRHLLARDSHQVLGADLATPARLVICWTPDGDRDGTGPRSGGTGQALRIASHWGLLVLNLARQEDLKRASEVRLAVARQERRRER
jgi:hypothetical protein